MSDRRIVLSRWATLIGYFGLLFLLLLWQGFFAVNLPLPRSLTILFTVTPLLLPLRGLLHGRVYTHAWTIYLSLPYFIHGVGETYSDAVNRGLSILEIIFSLLLFGGAMFYTRYRSREHKAQASESSTTTSIE